MRPDDLRTIAYLAMEQLGARLDKQAPGFVLELFAQAKAGGLLNYTQNADGTIYIYPLASKPATQVAGVQGIDSHGAMGDRS